MKTLLVCQNFYGLDTVYDTKSVFDARRFLTVQLERKKTAVSLVVCIDTINYHGSNLVNDANV